MIWPTCYILIYNSEGDLNIPKALVKPLYITLHRQGQGFYIHLLSYLIFHNQLSLTGSILPSRYSWQYTLRILWTQLRRFCVRQPEPDFSLSSPSGCFHSKCSPCWPYNLFTIVHLMLNNSTCISYPSATLCLSTIMKPWEACFTILHISS